MPDYSLLKDCKIHPPFQVLGILPLYLYVELQHILINLMIKSVIDLVYCKFVLESIEDENVMLQNNYYLAPLLKNQSEELPLHIAKSHFSDSASVVSYEAPH